jgi:adenylosuccinate synthase
MASTCVVGLQWGDEAKGKIVDLLTDQHDLVVRYNGGANAGHTVVVGDKTFKFSLLPTGVLRPTVQAVIAHGVVVYPPRFLEEVASLRAAGVDVGPGNLVVSTHAHVIFPYHLEEERLGEQGSEHAIGTTGRGIGPCYADKVGRTWAVRVGELLDREHLRKRLRGIVVRKNRLLRALAPDAQPFNVDLGGGVLTGMVRVRPDVDDPLAFDADALCHAYSAYAEQMRPHITDTTKLLHDALKAGKRILFEAAQGSLLDVDHGTYPYVTSSSSTAAGIWTGSSVPARNVTRIVGVIKAYSTRVGRGPFPTELDDGRDGIGERIRRTGREYGTVTGRPRRCGWFDTIAARYAAVINGVDELALMLLDVLSEVEEIKICTAYRLDGDLVDWFPGDAYLLEKCVPVYESLPGWRKDVSGARKLSDLPTAARRYIERLAELLQKPVSIVSVGPDRAQTLFCS